jgi:predicted ABC-type transport system involved in lysophospholipase L1 biosynthesis ATPase subunit
VTLQVVTHDADLGRRASRQIRMLDGRILHDRTGESDAPA